MDSRSPNADPSSQDHRKRRTSLLAQQLAQRHRQCVSDPGHDHQARIPLTALDAAHIGQINIGLESELLLRQLLLQTHSANRLPKDNAPISHREIGLHWAYNR